MSVARKLGLPSIREHLQKPVKVRNVERVAVDDFAFVRNTVTFH